MKKFMGLWNNGNAMTTVTSENKEQAKKFLNLASLGASDLIIYELLPVEDVEA